HKILRALCKALIKVSKKGRAMPIYEFYCKKCSTVYNFFSPSVNTEKIPLCPKCKTVELKRQMSIFARISGEKDEVTDNDFPPIDEAKMERAMALLADEADKINDDDPRQAAKLIRRLSEATGLNPGPAMEDALSRVERGEDPERIEQEMEGMLEDEDPFIIEAKTKKGNLKSKPSVDETLYDL
ncbi:MAG: zinc ribbon domain-containing protein, partial [Syntrophales bacterium]